MALVLNCGHTLREKHATPDQWRVAKQKLGLPRMRHQTPRECQKQKAYLSKQARLRRDEAHNLRVEAIRESHFELFRMADLYETFAGDVESLLKAISDGP